MQQLSDATRPHHLPQQTYSSDMVLTLPLWVILIRRHQTTIEFSETGLLQRLGNVVKFLAQPRMLQPNTWLSLWSKAADSFT
jgi:hypothetical protein